jgi:hypothetical protein
MNGDLLPLQLIFQGKTNKCLPLASQAVEDARFHLTMSENHWSSLETMKQYLQEGTSQHSSGVRASQLYKQTAGGRCDAAAPIQTWSEVTVQRLGSRQDR